MSETAIGRSLRRVDAEAKVRGAAVYCIDHDEPRLLHALLLRSPVPSGWIVHLDTAPALELPGVHGVVSAADAPVRSGLVIKDQELFARDFVRYAGEPIAAVAAENLELASAAVAAIELEIEPGPAVTDIESALAEGAPLLHPDWESYETLAEGSRHGNVAWETELVKGAVDEAFAREDVAIVADEFEVPRQYQSYIEPRCAVARFENGRYVIHSSTQFPFLVRDRVAELLRVRPSQVRILVPTVGGGFGGKLDAGPEPYCALLARKAPGGVKLVYTRAEEFVAATMRENARVRIRSAVTPKGEIVAQEALCLMDAGAYSGETPIIGSVPGLAFPSAYRFECVRYRTKVVYTNTPPTGAFRGVCGPYVIFALERHMDRIAAELGLDRRELRISHVYRNGDRFPNGQELPDVAFLEAFERIEEIAPWKEITRKRPFHGVGLAAVAWLTNPMAGSATVKLHEDGTVGLVTAATEIGTGAVAAGLTQIVSSELGVGPEDIVVFPPDTDACPYDAGAQGSRTLFNVGNALLRATERARKRILETAGELMEVAQTDLELEDGHVHVRGAPERRVSLARVAQTALGAGGPIAETGSYASPPVPFDTACMSGALVTHMNATTFHVHLAEVDVDQDTGKVTIVRYLVAQDVGRAVHPSAIEGQIQGGVLQGIGYALYENIRLDDGLVLELGFESYRLPTAADAPPVEIVLLEHPALHGPGGAKGVGEPPIVPVAAAVANAVSDAIGRPINRLPITPFDVLAALREEPPEAVASS